MLTHEARAAIVLVAALVATCGALALWHTRPAMMPHQLPRAAVARWWRPSHRTLARWLSAGAILAGIATGYWALRHSIHVFVVRDGRHGVRVQLRLASGIDPDTADHAMQRTWDELPSVWVINHSSREVRVEHEVITTSDPRQDTAILLPPGSAAQFERIDRIGPHADVSSGHDNWLTW